MTRPALLIVLVAGCGTTSLTPYGKFVLETHRTERGSSCLSDSHSHLRGPDGGILLEPLSLWELSGNRLWALAAGRDDARTLHLLDLEAGRVHSKHDLGGPVEGLGHHFFSPLRWSPDRDHLLQERIESARTRSLVLFSFEPTARVRTLFREEGAIATVQDLRDRIWAPDGSGVAFLVHSAGRTGPTRLHHLRFSPEEGPREVARSDHAPQELTIGWDGPVPRLD